MSIELIANVVLRGGALFSLLLLACSLLRAFPKSLPARLASTFAVGICAFIINSMPGLPNTLLWWRLPLIAIGSTNMFMFWLFTLSVTDESFTLKLWHGLVWACIAVLAVLNCVVLHAAFPTASRMSYLLLNSLPIVFGVLSGMSLIRTWSSDLVDERRRLRGYLIGAIAVYGVLQSIAMFMSGSEDMEFFSGIGNAIGIASLSVFAASRLLHAGGARIFAVLPTPTASLSIETPLLRVVSKQEIVPMAGAEADARLIRRLLESMERDHLYREENMSLKALADRLSISEYRLRSLINEKLGYRNFNSFLNTYRIAEVKRALADPDRAHYPILTLALTAGFQSIGPFNRAFKTMTGVTPTEYRANLRKSDPEALKA